MTRTYHWGYFFALSFILIAYCCCGYALNNDSAAESCTYDKNLVNQTIEIMHQQYSIKKSYTQKILEHYPCNPAILNLIKHPYEEKPWPIYRRHFISDNKVSHGISFWKQHRKTLEQTESRYHVPANIIVAIIGVESDYGQVHMKYPALQALATLAFSYPKRSQFFNNELMALILLGIDQHIDITSLYGSYAGALGMPQFMPTNYKAYCANYDKLGSCDLIHNIDDVIASVANYLHHFGWQYHSAVAQHTTFEPNHIEIPLEKNYTLTKLHITHDSNRKYTSTLQPTDLFTLQDTMDKQHWLVYNNFHVIMRYNQSPLYALAVAQLAELLEQHYTLG